MTTNLALNGYITNNSGKNDQCCYPVLPSHKSFFFTWKLREKKSQTKKTLISLETQTRATKPI